MSTRKLGFYVLITRGIPAMKRHKRMWDGTYSQSIDKSQVKYVINTRDNDFRTEAQEWLDSEGIVHVDTKSNGGPSKGKNAVFDQFLASDDDYMVMIDGDDFLTPHGLYMYKTIVNPEAAKEALGSDYDDFETTPPPDALCLENQFGIIPNEGYSWYLRMADSVRSASQFALDPLNQEHIHGWGYRCFARPDEWWQKCMSGNWIEKGSPFLRSLSDTHARLITYEHDYVNGSEAHCRVTLYSRKGAEYARFKEDLLVGEDILNYLDLKDACKKGLLNMKVMNEVYPTYVYDQRIGGIVSNANDMNHGRGWLDWMTVALRHFDAYKAAGKLHHIDDGWNLEQIPAIPYPADYKADTLGLVQFPQPGRKHDFKSVVVDRTSPFFPSN